MITIRAFSPKLGHLFPIFEKGKGRPPLLPPLVTRLKSRNAILGVLHEIVAVNNHHALSQFL